MSKAGLKRIVKDNLNVVNKKYDELGNKPLSKQMDSLEEVSDNLLSLLGAHNQLCTMIHKEMGCTKR